MKGAGRGGARAVVAGMGFIGSEVTASLQQLGVSVTAVFPGENPLDSVLGPEMRSVMAGIHRANGVALLPHDSVLQFEGKEKAEHAVTTAGQTTACDVALTAPGVHPNIRFLQRNWSSV